MVAFYPHKVALWVMRQVCFQKLFCFRQGDVHLVDGAASDANIGGLAFEDISAFFSIFREKVEMVTGNTE